MTEQAIRCWALDELMSLAKKPGVTCVIVKRSLFRRTPRPHRWYSWDGWCPCEQEDTSGLVRLVELARAQAEEYPKRVAGWVERLGR